MPATASSSDLVEQLERMDAAALDDLEFGVIGFDADEIVTVYNRFESQTSGLSPSRVIGSHFFTEVAPCTNNALVAERYRDEPSLDDELDYVFTLRMKPIPVHLRLLADPSVPTRYLIVVPTDAS